MNSRLALLIEEGVLEADTAAVKIDALSLQ